MLGPGVTLPSFVVFPGVFAPVDPLVVVVFTTGVPRPPWPGFARLAPLPLAEGPRFPVDVELFYPFL